MANRSHLHKRRRSLKADSLGIGKKWSPGASLGLADFGVLEQIRLIETGFPFVTVEQFQNHTKFSLGEVAEIVSIPASTLYRRKNRKRLSPIESERLMRVARLFELARALFDGDSLATVRWLETEHAALDDQTPLKLAKTEQGAREVENLIGRLEHGVFS